MASALPLEEGAFYHVYNRGINGENLFKERRNYGYFLQLYAHHLEPVAHTFAYCLLPNHFHLLVRIKTLEERVLEQNPDEQHPLQPVSRLTASRAFANLFSSYAQSINKAYSRTGGLFESPFHRKRVDHPAYYRRLVYYIHTNPERHGLATDFRDYPHSSYHSLLLPHPTRLQRSTVLSWFETPAAYQHFHQQPQNLRGVQPLLLDF